MYFKFKSMLNAKTYNFNVVTFFINVYNKNIYLIKLLYLFILCIVLYLYEQILYNFKTIKFCSL